MVLKTELCRFSGAKIYPGKGVRFIRSDSQVFFFSNSKCKRYFHDRLKPSKLTWTAMYRKQHKKLLRRGVALLRNLTQGLLLVLLWRLSKREEPRNLKFVMLPGRQPSVKLRRGLRKQRMKRRPRKLR
ncbi:hypothetical protein ACSBR2_026095 [Camellia fascicularis]